MSFRARVLTGLFWTAGARLLSQVFAWAVTIIVIRLLSPGDYGLLAMATVLISFLLLTAELGLGPAIVQATEIDETALKRVFGAVLLMNGFLLVLLFSAAPLVATFFAEDRLTSVIRVLALQVVPVAFSVIPGAQLQRRLDFKRQSVIAFLSVVVSGVLTLIFALWGFDVWALVIGSLAGSVCTAVGLNIVSPFRHWPQFAVRGTGALIVFGGNITASRLLWFFYSQVDILIVGKLLGKEMLGYYTVAMHLASLPVQKVSAIFNEVAFPAFAQVQKDRGIVAGHLLKGVRLLSFVSFPVFFGISSVAPEAVLLLLGPQWTAAILPLQVLALVMPLRLISNFLPSAVDGIGRPDISLKNLAWSSLIMPLAFVAGSNWGLVGISVAWVAAFPVVFVANVSRVLAALGLRVFVLLRTVAVPAISSVAMYGLVAATRHMYPPDTASANALAILVASGVLGYGLLVFAFNRQGVRELMGLLKT